MNLRFLTATALVASVAAFSAYAADGMNAANRACPRESGNQATCVTAETTGTTGTMRSYDSRADGLPMRNHSMMPEGRQPVGTAARRTVSTEDVPVAASEIVGHPVMTPSGQRFGEVTGIRGHGLADKDLLIRIDKAHRAKGLTLEDRATVVPMISGNGKAAVRADEVRLSADGRSLVVGRSSLRPIGS